MRSYQSTHKSQRSQKSNDKVILLTLFALVASGLVMVYSSSFIFAQEKYKDGLYFFKKHFTFILLGLPVFYLGLRIPINFWKKNFKFLFASALLLLLAVLIPGLSHKAGGASRWISFLGFTFQPSEWTKFVVLIFVALQLSKKDLHTQNFRSGFLTYFLGVIPLYSLLLFQPDFGTVALLISTTIVMMFCGGVRTKYFLITLGTVIPSILILIFTSPYRRARVLGFLDPWSDPAHKGFQVIQSYLAFYLGKWSGVGLGNSHEKLFYLPEAHNDFIFSVVGEELGFIGVVFFVFLYSVLLQKGLSIALHLEDRFSKALAVGISTLFGLQAFFNMGVVLGLLPTKGLPLPLVSYGGSSLLFTLFIMGILLQLAERTE